MNHTETDTVGANTDRLLVALCCGLLLVAPLAWTLGTRTYLGLLLGLVAAVVVSAAFGLLLQQAIPGSLGTALVTAAYFLPTVLVALLVVGPGSGPIATALAFGVPVAAVSAAMATWTARGLNQDHTREGTRTGVILVGLSLALCAAAFAPNVDDRLEDARLTAAIVAGFEGSGVLPLLPEVDGLSPSDEPRIGIDSSRYWIDLVVDGEDDSTEASSIHVAVGPLLSAEDAQIERSSCDGGQRTCTTDEDGFDVIEDPGSETRVVAIVGRTRMEATLYSEQGDLPEPEEVGRALLDAELVRWDDLLRLSNESR